MLIGYCLQTVMRARSQPLNLCCLDGFKDARPPYTWFEWREARFAVLPRRSDRFTSLRQIQMLCNADLPCKGDVGIGPAERTHLDILGHAVPFVTFHMIDCTEVYTLRYDLFKSRSYAAS